MTHWNVQGPPLPNIKLQAIFNWLQKAFCLLPDHVDTGDRECCSVVASRRSVAGHNWKPTSPPPPSIRAARSQKAFETLQPAMGKEGRGGVGREGDWVYRRERGME